MLSSITYKNLLDTLNASQKSFGEDELSYLALTSKVERPVRDKWAYLLQKTYGSKEISISREWHKPGRPEKWRTDLAIIQNERPLALIEIKAMYSFDAINDTTLNKFEAYLEEDKLKNEKWADENYTHCYRLLLVTHPNLNSEIPYRLKSIIKYQPQINRSYKAKNNSDAVKEKAIKAVTEVFGTQPGVLFGGSSFGMEVGVMYWLIDDGIKGYE